MTLKKLKFFLGHIEDFIDADWKEIRERARHFTPQTGLEAVEKLLEPSPEVRHPEYVLDRLAPFFDSGLMLRSASAAKWTVTDVFWRGSVFHLDQDERADASHLAHDLTPTQVQRAPAQKILHPLQMEFLAPSLDAQGYLLRPAPHVGFVLISNLADPFARDHMIHAHRLINKAFVY